MGFWGAKIENYTKPDVNALIGPSLKPWSLNDFKASYCVHGQLTELVPKHGPSKLSMIEQHPQNGLISYKLEATYVGLGLERLPRGRWLANATWEWVLAKDQIPYHIRIYYFLTIVVFHLMQWDTGHSPTGMGWENTRGSGILNQPKGMMRCQILLLTLMGNYPLTFTHKTL